MHQNKYIALVAIFSNPYTLLIFKACTYCIFCLIKVSYGRRISFNDRLANGTKRFGRKSCVILEPCGDCLGSSGGISLTQRRRGPRRALLGGRNR